MRIVVLVLCVLAVACAQQKPWPQILPGVWGPATNGWQAAIHSEKQSYVGDEPLWVNLVARNESGKTLKVQVGRPEWMVMAKFKIVRVTDGHVIELRPYRNEGERLQRFAGSKSSGQISPGGLVSPGFVNLHKLFDLASGTYNVNANCQLTSPEDPMKLVLVPTNQITVSVIRSMKASQ